MLIVMVMVTAVAVGGGSGCDGGSRNRKMTEWVVSYIITAYIH